MSGGFLASGITLLFKYFPEIGSAELIVWFKTYQGEVIFVAGVIGGLLYGPYAVYRKLQKHASQRDKEYSEQEKRLLKEAQSARLLLLENQQNTNSANLQQVGKAADKYATAFQAAEQPLCPFWRMKLMLGSGLLDLVEIPDSLRLFQQAVVNLGCSNPFEGVDALGEDKEWETDNLWPFLRWATKTEIFVDTNDPDARDPLSRYAKACLPYLNEGKESIPRLPLVAKRASSVSAPGSSEPLETPASTPLQP